MTDQLLFFYRDFFRAVILNEVKDLDRILDIGRDSSSLPSSE